MPILLFFALPRHDAIIIPGGGVREGAVLPPWVHARFDRALELDSGGLFLCLSTATWHRPPPLEHGFPISEAAAGARYLMARGIDPARIRIENASYDTIGNAYLTRLLFIEPYRWERLLIITSEFHMPRTRAIFEWICGLGGMQLELDFEASPDTGLSSEQRSFRYAKEAQGMENVARRRKQITTLDEMRDWFWTRHDSYSAAGLREPRKPSEAALLESY